MSTREMTISLINELNDNQIQQIFNYAKFLKAEANGWLNFNIAVNTPNAETLEAMHEVEEMKKNPSQCKMYSSFSEILSEALEEMNEDV